MICAQMIPLLARVRNKTQVQNLAAREGLNNSENETGSQNWSKLMHSCDN